MRSLANDDQNNEEFNKYLENLPYTIVSMPHGVDIYFKKVLGERDDYIPLLAAIRDLTEQEECHLFVNGDGGSISTLTEITDAISISQAKFIGHASGTVASAFTALFLACDEHYVGENLIFMIHNGYATMSGKLGDLRAESIFMDKWWEGFHRSVYEGFLTEPEIQRVINNQDMYLSTDDVVERLGHLYALRQQKQYDALPEKIVLSQDGTNVSKEVFIQVAQYLQAAQ